MSLLGARTDTGEIVDLRCTPNGELLTAPRVFPSETIIIPGIAAADALDAGDAFGLMFPVSCPTSGLIHGLVYHDVDNEKIGKQFFLYDLPFAPTANDAAFAPGTAIQRHCVAVLALGAGDYYSCSANAIGQLRGWNIPYVAPRGVLYCQVRTDGVDNIAVGAMPSVRFLFL